MKLKLYKPDFYRAIIKNCGDCVYKSIIILKNERTLKVEYKNICMVKQNFLHNLGHVCMCKDHKGNLEGKKL
jgi:hypothetical protein